MGKKKRTKKQLELELETMKANGSAPEIDDDDNEESEWLELSDELEARVMLVTPAIAQRWLERNHADNRPIRWEAVEAMANDARSGHFKLTHQAIAIAADGTLLDGQHRLSAIVSAETPVRLLIVRNRDGAFSDPIDRGRPRKLSMLLRISSKEAAALNMLRMLEMGGPTKVPATTSEISEILEHHGEAMRTIKAHVKGAHQMIGPLLAACIYTLPCEPDRVLAFAYKVQTGEMLQRGDPAYAFRNWKELNKGAPAWDVTMAALNCARYFATATPLTSVYTGDTGYMAITSKRRALGVPHTPGTELVAGDGGHWTPPARNDRERLPSGSQVEAVDEPVLRVTPAAKRGGMPGVDPFRPRGA